MNDGGHDAPRPIVIAHRGASGYLPEHTLAAYAKAIELGADFIEPDLVATADGVLIARHENELAASTDVAQRSEFASRRAVKHVNGVEREGWFSEDFTLAEIRTLRAREPRPAQRPDSARHDGRYGVPTFAEVVALAREAGVGIYPETKTPSYFLRDGRTLAGQPIGISLGRVLVETLVRERYARADRVLLQSFEVGNLVELARVILPAVGVALPLVQLFGRAGATPWDLRSGNVAPELAALARPTPDVLERRDTYAAVRAYASAIGIPRAFASDAPLAHARAAGLAVHVYTYRSEDFASADACADAIRADYARGVAAVFADQPELAVCARAALA